MCVLVDGVTVLLCVVVDGVNLKTLVYTTPLTQTAIPGLFFVR
jgi:hypothetical protein